MTRRLRGLVALAASAAALSAAPAFAHTQTIDFVNRAGIGAQKVRAVEKALVTQSVQLNRAWGTPEVRFADRGWRLVLLPPRSPLLGTRYRSFHVYGAQPYARVRNGPQWSIEASHELMEMLEAPYGHVLNGLYVEIADPVETLSYSLDGVSVSDFVWPAWYQFGQWPFDQIRRVRRPQSAFFGYKFTTSGRLILGPKLSRRAKGS